MNLSTLTDLASRLPGIYENLPSQSQISRLFPVRTHRSSGEFAAVFTLGLLVGAATALLNARQPGKELRKEIAERAGKLRERARERIAANGHARREHDTQL
jgi:hypothetical protein